MRAKNIIKYISMGALAFSFYTNNLPGFNNDAHAQKKKSGWNQFMKDISESVENVKKESEKVIDNTRKEVERVRDTVNKKSVDEVIQKSSEYLNIDEEKVKEWKGEVEKFSKDSNNYVKEKLDNNSDRIIEESSKIFNFDIEQIESLKRTAQNFGENSNRYLDDILEKGSDEIFSRSLKGFNIDPYDIDKKEKNLAKAAVKSLIDRRPGRRYMTEALMPYLDDINLPEEDKKFVLESIIASSNPIGQLRLLNQSYQMFDNTMNKLLEDVERQSLDINRGMGNIWNSEDRKSSNDYLNKKRVRPKINIPRVKERSEIQTYFLNPDIKPYTEKEIKDFNSFRNNFRNFEDFFSDYLSHTKKGIKSVYNWIIYESPSYNLIKGVIFGRNDYKKLGYLKKGDSASGFVGKSYNSENIFYKFPENSSLYRKNKGEMLNGRELDEEDLWRKLPVGTEVYSFEKTNMINLYDIRIRGALELMFVPLVGFWITKKIRKHNNKKIEHYI